MLSRSRALALAIAPILLLSACSSGNESADDPKTPPSDTAAPGGTFVGKVAETMDAGGYTYVRLEHGGESVWAAGPQGKVEVGEELGVSLGMKMNDFRSEALDRTFEAVYFVNAFERGGHPQIQDMTDAMGTAHSSAPETDMAIGEVATPPDGRTIASLWQDRAALAGKPVTLRGRVVKYNGGIMGRNWLHIQDGSGDAAAGTHDVAVTTHTEVSIGDIVLVEGTVAVDKDFGGGYRYGVIVEDANVERE